jgi:hypothetical protein
MLKDPPSDPHGTFVLADDDAELDAIAIMFQAASSGNVNNIADLRPRRHDVPLLFYHACLYRATVEVDGMAVQGERIAGGFILIIGIDGIRYAVHQ